MFNIQTPKDYFYHIKNSIEKYKSDKEKKIERLFFIINGLNHLREWIAPNYNPYFKNEDENPPKNKEQIFSKNIYDLSEHKIIRKICNGFKHLKKQTKELNTSYNSNVDEWENVDDILDVDTGSPSNYFVDNKNILEFIEEIAKYYEDKWFLNFSTKDEIKLMEK